MKEYIYSKGSLKLLTLYSLLKIYDLDPGTIKLVRHSNKEIQVLDTFRSNPAKLNVYQSFQKPNKFVNALSIAVFAPYYRTTALFLGIWDVVGRTPRAEFTYKTKQLLEEYDLPANWFHNSDLYCLKRNPVLHDLSERLVIEWGGATVAWVQSVDKEIVELKAPQSIGDFHSFDMVDLDFQSLKTITQYPEMNQTWVNALSSVFGVYLIRDTSSGELYVGSAYGKSGIFGRWTEYAQSGHGGNAGLKNRTPDNFRFSILEIVPSTSTAHDTIERENKWKDRLGTRDFGLNWPERKTETK